MVEKNSYHEVTFTDLTHDAMGVCKIEGYPVFVKDALKGEKALIKVTKTNKNFGYGRLIELREESPFRKRPICDHFFECGGCNMMHMNYEMQLGFKRHRVKETLRKLGHIETDVDETVGMSNPFYYRNKAIIPFGTERGKVIAGMFKPRTHTIVDIRKCHVWPKVFSDISRFLKRMFETLEVTIYDEERHMGVIRGIMLRRSKDNEQLSLTFITNGEAFPYGDTIVNAVIERFPCVRSVVQNINDNKTNVMLAQKSKVLYGEDAIYDTLLGMHYKISHRSFYQINPEQTEKLYQKALEIADLKTTDTVLDAYCGIGTIGLSAASKVKRVIGIESVAQAIEDARANAKRNEVDNAEFHTGKVEEMIPTFKDEPIDVLFVDPPRKGLKRPFIDAVIDKGIPRMVYISCNVSTLARDLNLLVSNGYRIDSVTPFDMFPQTSHIETVVRLTKA
ncbi:MAG: 23S rRNA (uracil(1939)-C(5))-methyltransferase RlmD [Bacillota bacterium]